MCPLGVYKNIIDRWRLLHPPASIAMPVKSDAHSRYLLRSVWHVQIPFLENDVLQNGEELVGIPFFVILHLVFRCSECKAMAYKMPTDAKLKEFV